MWTACSLLCSFMEPHSELSVTLSPEVFPEEVLISHGVTSDTFEAPLMEFAGLVHP